MKELNLEEKARRYDEALSRAKMSYHTGDYDKDTLEMLEIIFPELKESDDEEIRKWIIDDIRYNMNNEPLNNSEYNKKAEKAISWLEKQDKHNNFINAIQVGDKVTRNEDGVLVNISQLNKIAKKRKNQGEQVGKFHKGDWIVQENIGVYKVIEVCESWYEVIDTEDNHYSISFDKEYMCHLWTINDAKDCDILACNKEILLFKSYSVQDRRISLYCWYNGKTNNFHSKEVKDILLTTKNKIYPATKEQREQFEKTITNSGYEWDAEKKELKKIEQPKLTEFEEAVKDMMDDYRDAIGDINATTEEVKKHSEYLLSLIPKKTAEWNEEDESMRTRCIGILGKCYMGELPTKVEEELNWLKSIKDKALLRPKQEWSEEDEKYINDLTNYFVEYDDLKHKVSDVVNWLKSLKAKYIWKPSEQQIRSLEYIINNTNNQSYSCNIAKDLLADLKKLKG